mmetsp:Transcript_2423/g.3526  ORF Transcript_2423/g.3526 Transcript_2423/m.3526 type:complete len:445 (+) Transcript_2423:54-1388(+)
MFRPKVKSVFAPIHNYCTVPNFAIATIGTALAGWYLWENVLPYKNKEIFEAFDKLSSSRDEVRLEGITTLYDMMKKDKYARQNPQQDKFNEAADIIWELNGWTKLDALLASNRINDQTDNILEHLLYCMKTMLVSDKAGKSEKRGYILHHYGLHNVFQLCIRETLSTKVRIAALDLLKSLTKFNRLGRQLPEDTPYDSIGWQLVVFGESEDDRRKFVNLLSTSGTDQDLLKGLAGVLAHITEKPAGGQAFGKMEVGRILLEDRFLNSMRSKVRKNAIMALANISKESFDAFSDEVINKKTLGSLLALVPVLSPQRFNSSNNVVSESVLEIFWEIMNHLIVSGEQAERELVCEVMIEKRDHTYALFALATSYRLSTSSIAKKMIKLLKGPKFSKYADKMGEMAQASTKRQVAIMNHARQQQQQRMQMQMQMGMGGMMPGMMGMNG